MLISNQEKFALYLKDNRSQITKLIEYYSNEKNNDISYDEIQDQIINIIEDAFLKNPSITFTDIQLLVKKHFTTQTNKTVNNNARTTINDICNKIKEMGNISELDDYIEIIKEDNELQRELQKIISSYSKIDDKVVIPNRFSNYILRKLILGYCVYNKIEIYESLDNSNDYIQDNEARFYMQAITSIPLLTPEEEMKYAILAKNGDKAAKKKLQESNLRLVVSIAKNFMNKGIPFLDLLQEGSLGLMKAIDKYNPDFGYKLSTYATYWIRERIINVVNNSSVVNIPTYMSKYINKVKRTYATLYEELKRQPTEREVAESLNITEERLRYIRQLPQNLSSLNAPISDDEETTLENFVADSKMSIEDEVLQNIMIKAMSEILDYLTQQEKEIIEYRYGIGNNEVKTLDEIGKIYNITGAAVAKKEAKALEKLKRYAKSKNLDQYLK